MIIVGIHNTGTTSAACVFQDGDVAFAAAEERFNRQKHSKYFPVTAMNRGLKQIGATIEDVDRIAVAWNPAINLAGRFRSGFSEWPAFPGERLYSNANQILPMLSAKPEGNTSQRVNLADGKCIHFDYIDHHQAHAALSFLPSPYDEAAIMIVDGYGERACTVLGVGRGRDFEVLHRETFPNSLGSFYAAITQHLGFRPELDEWKVMGAAAYGDPGRFQSAMRQLIFTDDETPYRLDLNLFQHFDFDTPSLLSERGQALLGPRRASDDPMTQTHFDIAAAAQQRLEEILDAMLATLRKQTGLPSVCLGGGVAMNSVFNGKTTVNGPFSNVFIPSAPDDSGNAIGAALESARRHDQDAATLRAPISPYLGTSYDDASIADTLTRYGLSHVFLEDPCDTAASLLADGKIVGWFQGQMEFGQRALGNRSILADPRDPAMRDRINLSVKYRESFRPFAPAVLAESAADYFHATASPASPFMERVFMVREDKRKDIGAVVHSDGSGRLQTVTSEMNALFHQLICGFRDRTGIPIVLNTSFNTSGEPIVESPDDAIRTFFTSGLNALILGRYLIQK